jgi:hypothetical protein
MGSSVRNLNITRCNLAPKLSAGIKVLSDISIMKQKIVDCHKLLEEISIPL